MIEIKEVKESQLKMNITDKILRALPDYFGDESAIVDYVRVSADLPFWAVFDKGIPIGFLAAKPYNTLHAGLYVMGIFSEYQRISIGRGLFNTFQNYCINNNYRYISVKTLDSSCDYKPYNKTRKFYEAMGFQDFEVIKEIWDEENPCLIMIKDLKDYTNSYKCRSTNNG